MNSSSTTATTATPTTTATTTTTTTAIATTTITESPPSTTVRTEWPVEGQLHAKICSCPQTACDSTACMTMLVERVWSVKDGVEQRDNFFQCMPIYQCFLPENGLLGFLRPLSLGTSATGADNRTRLNSISFGLFSDSKCSGAMKSQWTSPCNACGGAPSHFAVTCDISPLPVSRGAALVVDAQRLVLLLALLVTVLLKL